MAMVHQKFDVNGPVRKGPREKALLFHDVIWRRTVLDVGCKRGEQTRWWAEHGAISVMAIDISQKAVDVATQFNCHLTNVTVLRADARSFHPQIRFGAVMMLDFIEHLTKSDAQTVYALCAKEWLEPGGWVGMSSPPKNASADHLYHQHPDVMRRDLENAGFVIKYLKLRDLGWGPMYIAKAKLSQ